MKGKLKRKRGRKKKQSRDTLKLLKFMNQWLFNPSEDTHQILTQDENYFFSNLIYRLYSLCESKPLMMIYLNKYMNSFHINKYNMTPYQVLFTFSKMLKNFGVTSPNMLYYSKYKQDEQMKFNKLISNY